MRDALHRCMDRACCVYRTQRMLVLLVMLAEGYHGIGGKISNTDVIVDGECMHG